MYSLIDYTIERIEPWNKAFESRLNQIYKGSRRGIKNVAYLYEKADTSTFRYRVYNMTQSLSHSLDWNASYFFENELLFLEDYLNYIDVVVTVRFRWSIILDKFLNLLKKRNIPVLFDTDDMVYNVKDLPLVTNTLNVDFNHPQAYEYWFTYVSRLFLTGTMSDATIGTNAYLSNRLKDDFDKPSMIIPNFMNYEQKDISEKLYAEKKQKDRIQPFVIGYFSGTPSHINDFKKVSMELKELLDHYPDILLRVVGFVDLPEYMAAYQKQGRIIHEPLVDFLTLQKKVAEVDVNIVPLVENEFTNCKSDLKFFESAIVGTITCASPVYSYMKSIKDGINGFICREGEWYDKIEHIYKGQIDKNIIENARDYCIEKYSPENQRGLIENVLNSVLKQSTLQDEASKGFR